jgi:polysaccharide biosynthesis transport protein
MNSAQPTQAVNAIAPQSEADLGYGQLFGVLWRNRWWMVLGLLAGLGLGGLMTMRQTPTYISNMQLLIEPLVQGKSRGGSIQDGLTDPTVSIDPGTQISLLQSSDLLQEAADKLKEVYPEEFGSGNPNRAFILRKGLSIVQAASGDKKSSSPTNIFLITYTSDNPQKTQQVLQALGEVYRQYNLKQQKTRLEKGLKFIDDQLPGISDSLAQSERRLESFRRDQELIDPKAQADLQIGQLTRVQQELQANVVQLRELNSRYGSLQQQLLMNPQQAALMARLSQSGRYQTLLNELQKTDLTLAQQRLKFKDGTDYVDQVQDLRNQQMQLLQTEAGRVLGDRTRGASSESLISGGQLSGLDTTLIGQLIEAQVALGSAQARYQTLAQAEQQLQIDLKRYPQLLAVYSRLEPEVELQRQTLNELFKARQELGLELNQKGFDWEIVERPLLGFKTGPDLQRNLLLGAVAGLFVAGLTSFAREALDDGVHSSEDLQRQTAIPLLGMVPKLYLEGAGSPIRLPFQKRQVLMPEVGELMRWQPFREALDLLYQSVMLAQQGSPHPIQALVLTSALAGEGKSTIALGLALSAARLNRRVLLIDGDLRRPSLHKLLNLPNEQGLSNLLMAKESTGLPSWMESDDRSNISIITSGPSPSDPAKLLSSPRMQELMTKFRDRYDLVIVDAPPVLGMVDAMLLASRCDGVLMVGRLDQVNRADIAKAMNSLKQFNLLGVVANGVAQADTSSNPYYQPAS